MPWESGYGEVNFGGQIASYDLGIIFVYGGVVGQLAGQSRAQDTPSEAQAPFLRLEQARIQSIHLV